MAGSSRGHALADSILRFKSETNLRARHIARTFQGLLVINSFSTIETTAPASMGQRFFQVMSVARSIRRTAANPRIWPPGPRRTRHCRASPTTIKCRRARRWRSIKRTPRPGKGLRHQQRAGWGWCGQKAISVTGSRSRSAVRWKAASAIFPREPALGDAALVGNEEQVITSGDPAH